MNSWLWQEYLIRLILYSMQMAADASACDSRTVGVQMSETLRQLVVMCDHTTLTCGKLSL